MSMKNVTYGIVEETYTLENESRVTTAIISASAFLRWFFILYSPFTIILQGLYTDKL
jgi:hypothetical protein